MTSRVKTSFLHRHIAARWWLTHSEVRDRGRAIACRRMSRKMVCCRGRNCSSPGSVLVAVCACSSLSIILTVAVCLNALFNDWTTSFHTNRGHTATVQSTCFGVMLGGGKWSVTGVTSRFALSYFAPCQLAPRQFAPRVTVNAMSPGIVNCNTVQRQTALWTFNYNKALKKSVIFFLLETVVSSSGWEKKHRQGS